MLKKIVPYIELTVPFSVTVSVFGVIIGGFMSLGGLVIDFRLMTAAVIYGISVAAFNVLNCIFDTEADRISKPFRPLPSMDISRKSAALFYLVLILVGLSSSYLLNVELFYLFLIVSLISVIYSLPPVKLKRVIHLNTFLVTLCYSLFPLLAGWLLFSSLMSFPVIIATIITILAYIMIITKDITDVIADKAYSVSTVPNIYGIKKTGRILKKVIFVPYLLILFFILINYFSPAYILTLLPLVGTVDLFNFIEKKPDKEIGERALVYAMFLGITTEFLFLIAYISA